MRIRGCISVFDTVTNELQSTVIPRKLLTQNQSCIHRRQDNYDAVRGCKTKAVPFVTLIQSRNTAVCLVSILIFSLSLFLFYRPFFKTV